MADKEFLDKAGLSVLWDRIRQYVYECCCSGGGGVTYHLESDGNVISLIGSDGSVSSVSVIATASCLEPELCLDSDFGTFQLSVEDIADDNPIG